MNVLNSKSGPLKNSPKYYFPLNFVHATIMLFFFITAFLPDKVISQVYTTKQDGNWQSPNTWQGNSRPNVNQKIYDQLIGVKSNKEIIVPTHKGKQGNPVLFSISLKNIIMGIEGDMGAKKILEINKDKIFNLEINDQSIVQDFNTQDNFASK